MLHFLTCQSTLFFESLEAAPVWHWACWHVLGWAWLKYIILFQLSLFLGGLEIRVASPADEIDTSPRSVCTKVYINTWLRPIIFFLYHKAEHSPGICCDWLTSVVSMSSYNGVMQFFAPFYTLLACSSCFPAPCKPSTRINWKVPTQSFFNHDFHRFLFFVFFYGKHNIDISRAPCLLCALSAVSTYTSRPCGMKHAVVESR